MALAVAMPDETDSLPSARVSRETISAEVARAASGMTNSALARRAQLTPRTLREILDPRTQRRFGRATLDKLDEAFGWRPGRAWSIYTAELERRGETVSDELTLERIELIEYQMRLLAERMTTVRPEPVWTSELVELLTRMPERERDAVLSLARRLAAG